ncbi:MAG: HK97 family phage prohead protease [Phycisphaerales bacterium]|nr:MAG: HK97 family phage prohead protease [Phycisphaerales bacterium]
MAVKKVERRFHAGVELREAGDAKDGRIATLQGYAALFDSKSEDLGGFVETIRAGAFKTSLDRGDDIRALVGHNTDLVIGRRTAKTLDISEDKKGLKVEIAVPDTSAGRDLVVSVKRGDITGMSFGFATVEDEWTRKTENARTVYFRELIEVDLFEVSAVAFPAYPETSVEARNTDRSAKDILEEGIRRLGKDAGHGSFRRRDRLISAYRTRVALWTGK